MSASSVSGLNILRICVTIVSGERRFLFTAETTSCCPSMRLMFVGEMSQAWFSIWIQYSIVAIKLLLISHNLFGRLLHVSNYTTALKRGGIRKGLSIVLIFV